MSFYEYKVVPAPKRGLKAKGLKTGETRFANALQHLMNEHGADGWEYQRTDTLPLEERQGLTGKSTSFQNMLVFRRTMTPTLATALISDQSAIPEKQIETDLDHPTAAAPAPTTSTPQKSDTAEFAFPWLARKAKAAAARKGRDPQVAAE